MCLKLIWLPAPPCSLPAWPLLAKSTQWTELSSSLLTRALLNAFSWPFPLTSSSSLPSSSRLEASPFSVIGSTVPFRSGQRQFLGVNICVLSAFSRSSPFWHTSIPCSHLSAPSSSMFSGIRRPNILSIRKSRTYDVSRAQADMTTMDKAWMPSILHLPPFITPYSLDRSSRVSISTKRPTDNKPHMDARAWVGMQPTGSSMRRRSMRRRPADAMPPPMKPISRLSQGRTTAQMAVKVDTGTNSFPGPYGARQKALGTSRKLRRISAVSCRSVRLSKVWPVV